MFIFSYRKFKVQESFLSCSHFCPPYTFTSSFMAHFWIPPLCLFIHSTCNHSFKNKLSVFSVHRILMLKSLSLRLKIYLLIQNQNILTNYYFKIKTTSWMLSAHWLHDSSTPLSVPKERAQLLVIIGLYLIQGWEFRVTDYGLNKVFISVKFGS